MWSHYGDCHRGICLEFQVLDESLFSAAVPVEYAKDYPTLRATLPVKDLADGMIRTKARLWKYEQEWRVLSDDDNARRGFPKQCLSGVILGCQISRRHESLITRWLNQRNSFVILYRAYKDRGKFAVRIEKVKEIGPPQ